MISTTPRNKFAAIPFYLFLLILGFTMVFGTAAITARAESSASNDETSGISTEAFVKSQAAQLFQSGKYPESIAALDGLLKQYPKDPLLIRYRAMALDQSGRSKEAIKIFEDQLLEYPNHVPTHYFLGQAYARDGQQEKASKE